LANYFGDFDDPKCSSEMFTVVTQSGWGVDEGLLLEDYASVKKRDGFHAVGRS